MSNGGSFLRGGKPLHIRAPEPPSDSCCWVIVATTDCTTSAGVSGARSESLLLGDRRDHRLHHCGPSHGGGRQLLLDHRCNHRLQHACGIGT